LKDKGRRKRDSSAIPRQARAIASSTISPIRLV